MKTAVVCDPRYKEHRPGAGHPERPERYDAVMEGIQRRVPADAWVRLKPRAATEAEVALCHTREYIDTVRLDVRDSVRCLRTGDTDVSERSMDVALLAVGGLLEAVDAVMAGTARNAFCAVRPPGHHASADRGMGFCIFNNVAVAARYAQRKHGIKRALIVDWDVHHGNGTQAIFYEDPTVFYFSTHQWPIYPGTGRAHEKGRGDGLDTTLNCPVAMGAGRSEILGAFRSKLVPAMRAFKPDFVLVSAGFDSESGDPLGGLALEEPDFVELTRLVMDLAGDYAGGRLVSALEGGYRLAALKALAGAHVRTLSEHAPVKE